MKNAARCLFWTRTGCLVVSLIGTALHAAEFSPKQLEFFETHIRPVLVEHCYSCHNSAKTAEAGLAVDSRDALLDSGTIEPGDPDGSSLLDFIRHKIPDSEMPKDGPKLSDDVIRRFEQWIRMGAPDPRDDPPTQDELEVATSWASVLARRRQWWSLQPIASPKPPEIEGVEDLWIRNPIDRFVAAKQREKGLSHASPARPDVLVRRLYFALIGLPPDREDMQVWSQRIQASRIEGVGELVDHLLDSPQFGEKWARHWMDWIRYAESHGSEGDPRIENAWFYRDYLIRALNADVPYNQLVREHIAGDLLEQPRIDATLGLNESAIATAHWRMVFHGFAPTDALDEKVRFVDDQVNAFSKGFLGLTVSCARCHDHKFDAISQKDYYAIFGVLAACRPGRNVVDTKAIQGKNLEQLVGIKRRIRQQLSQRWIQNMPSRERLLSLAKESKDGDSILGPLKAIIEHDAVGAELQVRWNDLLSSIRTGKQRQREFESTNVIAKWDFAEQGNQDPRREWLFSGIGPLASPSKNPFVVRESDEQTVELFPGGLYSHLISTKHAGRAGSPDVPLDREAVLWLQLIGDQGAQSRYVVQDYPRNGTVYPVTSLTPSWKWQRYDVKYWKGDSIHVELTAAKDAPLLVRGNDRSWFGIRKALILESGTNGPSGHLEATELLLSAEFNAKLELMDVVGAYQQITRQAIESWSKNQATDSQSLWLADCLSLGVLPRGLNSLGIASETIKLYRRLESEIKVPRRVPGLQETKGREQMLYERGNHKTPGAVVAPGFLEVINPEPYKASDRGRLALADDVLSDKNPLTKRVLVNRLWHHLFGRGIVATPDNFGRLGVQPTHPKLLDFLASRFSEDGWSIKNAIKLMVTSQAWQQSARGGSQAVRSDPGNQFITRANVRRLDAEAIRDSMLAVSGQLDSGLYGNPVGSNSRRRSVYVRVIRNALPPLLRAFDFPEPFTTTGRRDVTNVPAQSLMLMNDSQVIGYADALSSRARQAYPDVEQQIRWMFFRVLGREATREEVNASIRMMNAVKADRIERRTRVSKLVTSQRRLEKAIDGLQSPIRQRLLEEARQRESPGGIPSGEQPAPVLHWDFSKGAREQLTGLKTELRGGAKIQEGTLAVRSGGYATTDPLTHEINEKTLSVWVQLDSLSQRGGGVMSLQTRDGITFDAIVFGEQEPGKWMSGSNHFARTKPLGGDAESVADKRPVHIAIVYSADGKVMAYRNGKPYGNAYESEGPVKFKKSNSIVSFGLRHLPAGGNRMLSGAILKASLFDQALTARQVKEVADSGGFYLTEDQILTAMSPTEKQQLLSFQRELDVVSRERVRLGEVPSSDGAALLSEVARSLFTFKEFLFIQ